MIQQDSTSADRSGSETRVDTGERYVEKHRREAHRGTHRGAQERDAEREKEIKRDQFDSTLSSI